MKKLALLHLSEITEKANNTDEINIINKRLFLMFESLDFSGGKLEIEKDKNFTQSMQEIQSGHNINTEGMTTFDYFNALELIEKKTPKKKIPNG